MSAAASAWRRLGVALLLLGLLAAGLFRVVPFRAELSDLLPPAETPAARYLLQELRGGAATTLLLAGIEGAPEPELARISRAVGDALRASEQFAFVGNGTQDLPPKERDLLFRYRYLLSAAAEDPSRFTAPALRQRLESLIDGLRSAASPVLAQFGFADPAGAFLDLLRSWLGESRVALRDGVWFAADAVAPRALVVARGRAPGTDLEAQAAMVAAFETAFAAADPGPARLMLRGPGVFSAAAAAAVEADVRMISILSGVLIAAFLLWRTRSLLMLAAVAVPLLVGMLAGTALVFAAFGAVHGAAFGFGMTMLGVGADYPMLLVGQRRPGEALGATARRLGGTLGLSALAAALGLTAMLFSGFPLLAQLGLFGAAGLLAGAAATRWLLPCLLPGEAIRARPLPPPMIRALRRLRGHHGTVLLLPLAAAALLVLGGPRWNDDINRLSPVPERLRQEDAELRRQLGAPDVGTLIALRGADAEAVLRRAEAVQRALDPLVAAGALAGFDSPARYLPSAATQRARQAALPGEEALRAALAEAAAGLPFRATAFDRFLAGIADSRTLPPLTIADLAPAPTLSARLGLLLSDRDGAWQGLVIPNGLRDLPALSGAVAALNDPDILFVNIKGETEGLVAAATGRALRWVAAGGAAVLLLLWLALRRRLGWAAGLAATALTALPIGGALLVTLAGLTALGQALNPFHLAALLLAAGVGLDYALFLGVPVAEDAAEGDRNFGAVFNCTATTLLTFGLLSFCATPVLQGIGLCVSIGVAAAFLLALALAPRGVVTARPPCNGSTGA
ncbi:MMPL family transporter [Teichococcus vastitatis]|uniref:MMPL family transporter n=1 Tax=Teichococcus vastitatis TaxID=2307076 RepID=A0ABS9W401_9PROT|nr:MMPL family transporter [Pseudoroseomonas vastitatis]MCI0754004.1 MMPL family transporter [Pseudoroseomonas vastitatis]